MKRSVFLSHIIVWLAFAPIALGVATQYVASKLGYQAELGAPLFTIGVLKVYAPWSYLSWAYNYWGYAAAIFETGERLFYAAAAVAELAAIGVAIWRTRRAGTASTAHGSARWAPEEDLKGAGLLSQNGVVLCQTADAEIKAEKVKNKDALALQMKTPGKLVRHEEDGHIFVFAPTGTGKGVGIVIPTLLAWRHSVIVYDIKKELWQATAGWRRQFTRCWRFEPSAEDSLRFNPLFEIRRGPLAVKDAQNVADMLVDPNGSSQTRDHWQKTSCRLLVGAILHVLYAEANKSLNGVLRFLTDPGRDAFQTLDRMLSTNHHASGPDEVVASIARDMMNKSANELSGVFSSAIACLGLYDDPMVAANTSSSDFRLNDLMNSDRPVSFYLVTPPSDIDRLRPLIRLVINQICRRLTETINFDVEAVHKHRLLMLIDEFPLLGNLAFFETALAFVRGYGIKCMLIAQDLKQLEKAYGPSNSILANCAIRIAYRANCDHTAQRLSNLLGPSTRIKRQLNFSGSRIAPWLSKVSESEQEYARPLLTAGEILTLPLDQVIVLTASADPYLGKKVVYFQDPRFKDRVWRPARDGKREVWPPPNSKRAQRAELVPNPEPSPWLSGVRPTSTGGGPAPVTEVVSHAKAPATAPASGVVSHAKDSTPAGRGGLSHAKESAAPPALPAQPASATTTDAPAATPPSPATGALAAADAGGIAADRDRSAAAPSTAEGIYYMGDFFNPRGAGTAPASDREAGDQT
jgi:type IV secretion system protein VirD4